MIGTPAFAAGDFAWYSMNNTSFVVLIAFVIFLGVLVYYKVPGIIGKLLDDRAVSIKAEIDA